MPKFNVTVSELNTITVEVTADDAHKAYAKASEMMDNDEIDFSNGNTDYNVHQIHLINK
jgi:hypothetical protein